MAIKDVINYFNECEAQYKDFVDELNSFNELCAQNMVPPETVENAKKLFQVVEDNYKKLNYIIFLLNKPTKKEKFKNYCRQNKKIISNSITKEKVIAQNADAIKNIQNLKQETF